MKINKKAIAIITIVFLIFNYFRPTIVIHGAPNKTLLIEVLMDFHDKYYDGDASIWYVERMESATRSKICKENQRVHFKYPILYDTKGPQNYIFMFYILKGRNKPWGSLHRFFVNAKELYFFRITVYIDNDGEIKESYIRKYPWSRKQLYVPDD